MAGTGILSAALNFTTVLPQPERYIENWPRQNVENKVNMNYKPTLRGLLYLDAGSPEYKVLDDFGPIYPKVPQGISTRIT
jgi:hypothetical protein